LFFLTLQAKKPHSQAEINWSGYHPSSTRTTVHSPQSTVHRIHHIPVPITIYHPSPLTPVFSCLCVRVCASTVDDVETEAFGQAETQSETGKQHHRTFRDREPLRILYHIYLLPPLTPISSGAFNFDLYSIFHPSKPIRSSALCSVIAIWLTAKLLCCGKLNYLALQLPPEFSSPFQWPCWKLSSVVL